MAKKDDIDEQELSNMDATNVRILASNLEKDFNRTRERLYYTVQYYFHQPIVSNYIKASTISDLLDKCESIKAEYLKFKDEIRELHKDDPNWTFRNFNF